MQQERMVYTCPHCESPDFVKFGKEKNIQRYRCKKCLKTFRATTGTSLHYLHKKDLTEKYIQTMQKGLSIRKAAQTVGISTVTSFIWRHKFLASLSEFNTIGEENGKVGKGVKIIKIPYSSKGRRKEPEKHTKQSINLIITGQNRTSISRLTPSKHVKNASNILANLSSKNQIAEVPDRILKSAINRSGKIRINKKTQAYKLLQNKVTLKTTSLMNWMDRFQGVASKYLQHYWNWFAVIDNIKQLTQQQTTFYTFCTTIQSRDKFFQTNKT